jgi:SWI/SNF-related matrix-associated actin-dependent regulator of chromatin subfamily A3
VLRTWEAQILEHCSGGLLSVYTYHEKGRDISPSQLQKYDVVITSYNTCAGDFARISGGKQTADAGPSKKQKGTSAIYSIAWKVRSY